MFFEEAIGERMRDVGDEPDDVLREDIIILDDVTTSGATLGDAARALKAAGARKIIGLTAAKA